MSNQPARVNGVERRESNISVTNRTYFIGKSIKAAADRLVNKITSQIFFGKELGRSKVVCYSSAPVAKRGKQSEPSKRFAR